MRRGPHSNTELGLALLMLDGLGRTTVSSYGKSPLIVRVDTINSGGVATSWPDDHDLRAYALDATERAGLTWREAVLQTAAQVGLAPEIDTVEAVERAALEMAALYRKLAWMRDAPKIRRHSIVSRGTPWPRTSEDSDLLECEYCGAESASWDESGVDYGRGCVERPDGKYVP